MFICVEGRMGSGKTLTMTTFATLDFMSSGRRVIANYNVNLERANDDGFVREVVMLKYNIMHGMDILGTVPACYPKSAIDKFVKTMSPQQGIDPRDLVAVPMEGQEAVQPSFMYLDYATFVKDMEENREFYGCFPAWTKILVKNPFYVKTKSDGKRDGHGGLISIDISNVKVGDEVLSYNELTGAKEFKKVTKTYERESSDWFTIHFSNGNFLELTSEHPLAVIDAANKMHWVEAKNVKVGDKLIQYKYSGLNLRCTQGSNYSDMYGIETAARMQSDKSNTMLGKSYEERLGKEKSDDIRLKQSISHKKEWDLPDHIKAQFIKDFIAYMHQPGKDAKQAEIMRKLNLETGLGFKKAWQTGAITPETISKSQRIYWEKVFNDPILHDEICKARSEYWKNRWKDKEFAAKRIAQLASGKGYRPSKLEKQTISLFDNTFANEWKYVGDNQFRIEKYNPDFINCNGKKKLIEVLGCWWHRCPICGWGTTEEQAIAAKDVADKKELFQKYGFDALFIWEHEFENKNAVVDKVREFTYNPNVEIVEVTSMNKMEDMKKAYNLEVEQNNNYFAYGILAHNCSFLIDEAYLWADSRLSQTAYSRLLTYFVFQSRKRDVDLYVTSQQFENLDIRLRRNCEIRALCRTNKKNHLTTARLLDLRTGQKKRIKIYGPEIWKFYDTLEIPPLQQMHTGSVKV